jgi:NAD(P)H-hydrate epimerase
MTATLGELAPLLARKDAVAIGPGMPDDAAGRAWLDTVLDASLPTVVDATALDPLVGRLDLRATATAPLVLTPHPGEAARLLGTTAAAVEADRMSAVRGLAAATRATILLKGARTLVCDAAGFVTINPTGGPSLATAGSGDVLTGLIAALLAQGLPAATAARLAAYLHGAAGDTLAIGATASDIASALGTGSCG